MSRKLVIIVVLILIAGAGGFLVFGRREQEQGLSSKTQKEESQAAIVSRNFIRGQKAPEMSFTDFEGNSYQLSEFEGKAVILDFWAAWCPFCVAEMPELQKAQDRYPEALVMIGIHRTDTESIERGLSFANDRGVTYLLVTDPDGSAYQAAGGVGMPVAVFIDSNGVVSEIKSGPKTEAEIEEKVSKLIE